MIWFRAYKEIKIEHLFLGYYIEYLFYGRALDNNCNYLSRWLDRNMYWAFWSNIWLALHKLQYKFLPYLSKKSVEIELDEYKIDKESLLFTDPDKENVFRKAILWTNKNFEEIENIFGIIKKRWLDLEIRKIHIL